MSKIIKRGTKVFNGINMRGHLYFHQHVYYEDRLHSILNNTPKDSFQCQLYFKHVESHQ